MDPWIQADIAAQARLWEKGRRPKPANNEVLDALSGPEPCIEILSYKLESCIRAAMPRLLATGSGRAELGLPQIERCW